MPGGTRHNSAATGSARSAVATVADQLGASALTASAAISAKRGEPTGAAGPAGATIADEPAVSARAPSTACRRGKCADIRPAGASGPTGSAVAEQSDCAAGTAISAVGAVSVYACSDGSAIPAVPTIAED
ncbi:hypothetical protein BST27_25080 [Mycobacterium intermedium]|uniref:Uncharacterized protein n=1 Tax=Mycobacterium intermedium TaxID=28445 RepID=A0A1E3S523_MYCIE|nr:hypothetical protein BHQ20_27310 [Mycobacterium intermedium]OPE45655.1 hypothetical protein BV508_28810 [Mycobacterium intermedium]ORA96576.1 hypothetical protein BST27_25080 [Mycobacterium intermedium]